MANKTKYYQDSYDVIVIGGALSSFAAALTLAKKGKKVLVLEQHNLPGGVATSFVRGGVEMEASLHEMMSVGPKECPLQVRQFFDEMGVDVEWLRTPEAYCFVDGKTGESCVVHAGDHGDYEIPAREIAEACGDTDGSIYKKVLAFLNVCHDVFEALKDDSLSSMSKLQILLKYPNFAKTAGYSSKEVLEAFDLPQKAIDILSAYWIYVGDATDNLPFTVWGYLMGDYLGYGAYIPKKCSFEMSLKMCERARELGAQVEFNQRVDKILVKNGHVEGVRLANGTEIAGRYVVCSAYPNKVYTSMVEPISEVPPGAIRYVNSKTMGLSCFSVILLLDQSPEELGIKNYSTFHAAKGMDMKAIWNETSTDGPYSYITSICMNLANPGCTPEGTCLYSITMLPRPEGWFGVSEENYEEMKRKNAEYFIDMESKRLGVNLKEHILEIVIETPVTVAHYTGAYQGSIYGYMHTMDDHVVGRQLMSEKENFIQGLSFCGAHQLAGDGMAPVISNGRASAKIILEMMKKDGKEEK